MYRLEHEYSDWNIWREGVGCHMDTETCVNMNVCGWKNKDKKEGQIANMQTEIYSTLNF